MNKKSIFRIITSLSIGIAIGASVILFSPGYLGYRKALDKSGMPQGELEDMLINHKELLRKCNEAIEDEGLMVAALSLRLLINQRDGNINKSQAKLHELMDNYYQEHIQNRTVNSLSKEAKAFKDKYEEFKKSNP